MNLQKEMEKMAEAARSHTVIDLSKKASNDVAETLKRTTHLLKSPLEKGFVAIAAAEMMVTGAAAYFAFHFRGTLNAEEVFDLLINYLTAEVKKIAQDADRKGGIMESLGENHADLPEALREIMKDIEAKGGKISEIIKITGKL